MDAAATLASKAAKMTDHPYYPIGVHVAGYLANERSVPHLLAIFAAGCAVIFGGTYFTVKAIRPRIPNSELVTVMWFVLSGSIHLWFEGYYAINQANMGGLQTLFGQLWKEYALSDSRYLTQNAFVLCMESITAFLWGPLCYIVAASIATDSNYRHPLQALVSLGQLYGDVLYYATSMFDHYVLDMSYSRPEAYYFYGYYVLMNAFWIVIPGWLLYNSVQASANAFGIARSVQGGKKSI